MNDKIFLRVLTGNAMTFKNVRENSERKARSEQLSREQPLIVTQIALIERNLPTRAHTGIYVSNFIAQSAMVRCVYAHASLAYTYFCVHAS